MHKPWLEQYPKAMPQEIEFGEYSSLAEFVEVICARYASKPAFANMGRSIDYATLEEKSRAFANYLRHELKLQKGERVAVMLPNLLQNPIAILGTLRAGLIVVNTNPLYTPRELEHQLKDSEASTIVILENFVHVLERALPQTQVKNIIVTRMGDMLGFPKAALVNFVVKHVKKLVPPYAVADSIDFMHALEKGIDYTFENPDLNLEDTAFLQYTGGTTGVSKGAMLSHGNMLANIQQAALWITHTSPPSKPLALGQDVIITAIPLYHIFALLANCLVFMSLGGLNVLITNPRDLPGFVKELKRQRFTCITGVNTLYNCLLNTQGFDTIDFSALRIALGGGMAVQKSVADHWQQVTGCPLVEAYGLTETSPAVCINPADLPAHNGSIGLPLPSTECAICDDQGQTLAIGETGELCVRGPQVMQGYWKYPQETAQVLNEDGWLRTGDIARMDDKGYIYLVDRKRDMILVSGFNVYPSEIEEVVAAHPGILECGVIGVSDEKTGEAVKLVAVKKDQNLNEDSLRSYCREQLTAYKVPKHIEFRTELPKSNVGKILRRELRNT